MVRVFVDNHFATLDQGEWTAETPEQKHRLEFYLKSALSLIWGDNPTPELVAAQLVMSWLGGRIVESEAEPDTVVGRIY